MKFMLDTVLLSVTGFFFIRFFYTVKTIGDDVTEIKITQAEHSIKIDELKERIK